MKRYYGVSYLARRLRVGTATVYYWLKESGREDWGHTPVPEADGCVTYSKFDDPVLVWSEDLLPEWDNWYRTYKNNKWKTTTI